MFGSAPKASWLLKGAARAGLEWPTAVRGVIDGARARCVAATRGSPCSPRRAIRKTLAFGWPLLAHVAAQEASRGSEPVALVVVPDARKLCEQVYRELTRHAKYAPRTVGTVAVPGAPGSGRWRANSRRPGRRRCRRGRRAG